MLLSDVYSEDAQGISDGEWLRYAGQNGFAGLTKDKRIRYQAAFQLASTPVFALSDGALSIAEMVLRFDAAQRRIWASATATEREFWIVYGKGRVERRFP